MISWLLATAMAVDPQIPNLTWTADQLHSRISPDMETVPLNQPSVIDGALMLAGNGEFFLWDISDPFHPERLSSFESPYNEDEAESHAVAYRKTADGRTQAALISGLGVDLWDLTDLENPVLLHALDLEGVRYGDNSEAVWGVAWQGRWLFVGGTNTGIHVVDTLDPTQPEVVTRMPSAAIGGASAGPVFAHGNLLVVTTPKEHAGVATVDISDPTQPALLDFVAPSEDSYIGGFYGGNAYLITPIRTYDVTTDPTNIQLLGSVEQPGSEYLAFGDDHAFIGSLRPNPGVRKYAVDDLGNADLVSYVEGRRDDVANGFFTDDQFTLPVGNMLVLADDEVRFGAWLAPHDTRPDTQPPRVLSVNPPDGASQQALTSRVGISLSDQIDSRSLVEGAIQLRKVGDPTPLAGSWGLQHTVVTFDPAEPLEQDTVYEIVVPVGGLTDLVGNAVAQEWRSLFSTGSDLDAPPCEAWVDGAGVVGGNDTWSATEAEGATFSWDFGDGATGEGPSVTHTWQDPGRKIVTLTVERDGLARSCTTTTAAILPPAEVAPASASTVVIDEARRLAWTVLPDHDAISAVSLDTRELVAEVAVPPTPRTLALAEDGTVWVACQEGDALVAVDPDAGAVRQTLQLRWAARPYGVVLSADGSTLHTTYEDAGIVAHVDVASGEVTEVPLKDGAIRPRLRGLGRASDGRLVVPRFLSSGETGTVFLVDGEAVETLPLAWDVGPDEHNSGRGLPNHVAAAVIAPDGVRVALPSKKDNLARGAARDGEALDADNTVRSIVSWLDLRDDSEDLPVRVDLDDHEGPVAATFSPRGDLVFVASRGTNQVDVFDPWTGDRSTGLGPAGLAISSDGILVVDDALSRTLSVFDVGSVLDGTDPTPRSLAVVSTASDEVLDAQMLLGKQLFHLADSRQMSQDGYISCATCHVDGSEDGQVWDFTDRGEGLRNTIDLRGRRGMGHGPVHWSANFDEIQDFEHDIRSAFGGGGLMDDADFADGTDEPLGAPKAGYSERLDALAAYVTSFDSFPRSPHRQADGNLSEDAEAGRRLFEAKGCLDCHSGPDLTDSASLVRHDVGTMTDDSGNRLGGVLDGIDTPTLLGVHATAPYLHDGSALTLQDAFGTPEHGGRLNDRQRDRIAQFLLELEDDQLPLEARGCACNGGSTGGAWLFPGLLLLLGRRRR
jgi:hypothetical protein